MSKKRKVCSIVIFSVILVALLAGIFIIGIPGPKEESIQEVMKDAVLHESIKIDLFGLMQVNPAVISAFVVTGIFIVFALIVRIFVIPKFTIVPGKFQMVLETAVSIFSNMAKSNSPHKNGFLGAYAFAAGAYIFVGTLFELIGIQAVSVSGLSVSLPAPLADINGAIAMGVLTYSVILVGGIIHNGFRGFINGIKEFSLPISMSFRLFGALLSGALVTELVYYTMMLSFVLPVIVGVLFTLIHALIQAYVLTTLATVFYGEVTEPPKKKEKKIKKSKKNNKTQVEA